MRSTNIGWSLGLALVGMAVMGFTDTPAAPAPSGSGPSQPSTSLNPIAPTSTFQLPKKPPRPSGGELMKQIVIALITVGGCAAAGTVLVVLDARYEKANDAPRLKAIRSVEHGFLGVIVVLGTGLLVYAGYELLKSAGLL